MLSVFIPSFNHAAYVTEAIASARAIDVPGKHIYVIDDASTDGSADVIERYLGATGAEDITFIRKTQNRGAIDSMLTFLGLCRTEYIYVVASDDIVIPTGVAELVRRMEERSSLGFIIGGGSNLMSDGRLTPIYGQKHSDILTQSPGKLLDLIFLVDLSPLLCQSSVFRTSALRRVDAVVAEIVADDYAIFSKLFLRFNHKDVDFAFLPQIDVVRYRHHGHNSYRQIDRQVAISLQVLKLVAPHRIRNRAIAYKLAFFLLIAARRGDAAAALRIVGKLDLGKIVWFIVGLASNIYWWGRYR